MKVKPNTDKVTCKICNYEAHALIDHLAKKHSLDPIDYLDKHPGAALWSGYFASKLQARYAGTTIAYQPRARRNVELSKLFPTFGVAQGLEVEGEYPIFDTPGPLTPKLDPMYVFPEEQTLDMMAILLKAIRNNVYIWGWSGTGKSTLTYNLAALLNAEIMKLNADSYLQRSTIIGAWRVKDGETVWEYGILPLAMMRGCWLVINEFDILDPHAANIFKPVLEDGRSLTILENGGEVITAHPDFRIIATANTWGRGDASGMFVNTHVQSDADMRRWNARLKVEYMDESVEVGMLKGYFPKTKDADLTKFVQVANKVREAFKVGKIDKTFSPAELVNWVENWSVLGRGVHHAAKVSFLNALEPDVYTAIDEMVGAVFGRAEATS